MKHPTRQSGFTLLELMVMLMGGLIVLAITLAVANQVSKDEEAERVVLQILTIQRAANELYPSVNEPRYPSNLQEALVNAGAIPPGVYDPSIGRLRFPYMRNNAWGWVAVNSHLGGIQNSIVIRLEPQEATADYRAFCARFTQRIFPLALAYQIGGEFLKANRDDQPPTAATVQAACSQTSIMSIVLE
jgi:type II secretory pathway pseudopilin PulG